MSTGLQRLGRGAGRRALALLPLLASLACAPMQTIPIDVSPRPVQLYVDGEERPGDAPEEIELRADQPHVLFFRKPGHRAEQVVLRIEEGPDGPVLSPASVSVTLTPEQPKGRRLEIELDSPPSDATGEPVE